MTTQQLLITTFAKQLTDADITAVKKMITDNGATIAQETVIAQHTNHIHDSAQFGCVEFTITITTDKDDAEETFRQACLSLAQARHIDVSVQQNNGLRDNTKLVCFDMDSTLIEQEVIVELAKAAGIGEQVAAITERAMQGDIDFNESFTQRVALLKGLSTEVLTGIAENLTITEGAELLINSLKQHGYRTAILSGGFTYFAEYLKEKLGIDEVHANTLDIKDGKCTGEVVLPIVDATMKAKILQNISKEQKIDLCQTVAIGDGANDLEMLAIAGLGVAFRAKPLVRERAKQSVSNLGLDGVLYLLGISQKA